MREAECQSTDQRTGHNFTTGYNLTTRYNFRTGRNFVIRRREGVRLKSQFRLMAARRLEMRAARTGIQAGFGMCRADLSGLYRVRRRGRGGAFA